MIARMDDTDPASGDRIRNNLQGLARSPPRNENGEIFCNHKECEGKGVTFRRPCEYKKHVDRHERPYKCTNPACEQNPGFTYSGGLLRHQREVHKMHLSKQPLYCPYSNCVRSAGTGFTRKENLDEHIRRRHETTAATQETQATLVGSSTSPPLGALPGDRKRSRQTSAMMMTTLVDDGFSAVANGVSPATAAGTTSTSITVVPSDHEHVIKKLKMDLARQNQLLLQQARELDHLRQLLRSLPPSLIYQRNSSTT